ncbi:hypothetical protein [Undibacterium sp. RuTC16W]|uniref:hypothetical protein n=1 Tax=Undibacterium sp. RuTC16W TaxID=3413048 RepID=UPI003BF38E73
MDNNKHKKLVSSAVSGIKTIMEVSNLAGIPLNKTLNAESLKLWADVIAAFSECMSGEEMGVMFALIINLANKGSTISDIEKICLIDLGEQFAMRVDLKIKPEDATTIH